MSLKNFVEQVTEAMLAGKTPPPADTWDDETLPFGKAPGDNKFGAVTCPTCGKPPSRAPERYANILPNGAFLFRDKLSAQEYRISGMCQACQDKVFGRGE